jgi:hypothetical protein
MHIPEFVGLQVSVLVRSDAAQSNDVLAYLESVEFKAEMQENLANLIKASLTAGKVPFHEVIISLDQPPVRAKPVERSTSAGDRSSILGRLFGRR